MSKASDRRRDIARWHRLTMTDAELAERGRRADEALLREEESHCSECGVEIPNQQCGGLCEDCLAAGPTI